MGLHVERPCKLFSHGNYLFTYLNHKSPVYYISKYSQSQPKTLYASEIYSVPFKSKKDRTTRNVLVGFADKTWCVSAIDDLVSAPVLGEPFIMEPTMSSVTDIKYLANVLKIPVAVLVKAYCDLQTKEEHFELFYHQPKKFTSPHKLLESEVS